MPNYKIKLPYGKTEKDYKKWLNSNAAEKYTTSVEKYSQEELRQIYKNILFKEKFGEDPNYNKMKKWSDDDRNRYYDDIAYAESGNALKINGLSGRNLRNQRKAYRQEHPEYENISNNLIDFYIKNEAFKEKFKERDDYDSLKRLSYEERDKFWNEQIDETGNYRHQPNKPNQPDGTWIAPGSETFVNDTFGKRPYLPPYDASPRLQDNQPTAAYSDTATSPQQPVTTANAEGDDNHSINNMLHGSVEQAFNYNDSYVFNKNLQQSLFNLIQNGDTSVPVDSVQEAYGDALKAFCANSDVDSVTYNRLMSSYQGFMQIMHDYNSKKGYTLEVYKLASDRRALVNYYREQLINSNPSLKFNKRYIDQYAVRKAKQFYKDNPSYEEAFKKERQRFKDEKNKEELEEQKKYRAFRELYIKQHPYPAIEEGSEHKILEYEKNLKKAYEESKKTPDEENIPKMVLNAIKEDTKNISNADVLKTMLIDYQDIDDIRKLSDTFTSQYDFQNNKSTYIHQDDVDWDEISNQVVPLIESGELVLAKRTLEKYMTGLAGQRQPFGKKAWTFVRGVGGGVVESLSNVISMAPTAGINAISSITPTAEQYINGLSYGERFTENYLNDPINVTEHKIAMAISGDDAVYGNGFFNDILRSGYTSGAMIGDGLAIALDIIVTRGITSAARKALKKTVAAQVQKKYGRELTRSEMEKVLELAEKWEKYVIEKPDALRINIMLAYGEALSQAQMDSDDRRKDVAAMKEDYIQQIMSEIQSSPDYSNMPFDDRRYKELYNALFYNQDVYNSTYNNIAATLKEKFQDVAIDKGVIGGMTADKLSDQAMLRAKAEMQFELRIPYFDEKCQFEINRAARQELHEQGVFLAATEIFGGATRYIPGIKKVINFSPLEGGPSKYFRKVSDMSHKLTWKDINNRKFLLNGTQSLAGLAWNSASESFQEVVQEIDTKLHDQAVSGNIEAYLINQYYNDSDMAVSDCLLGGFKDLDLKTAVDESNIWDVARQTAVSVPFMGALKRPHIHNNKAQTPGQGPVARAIHAINRALPVVVPAIETIDATVQDYYRIKGMMDMQNKFYQDPEIQKRLKAIRAQVNYMAAASDAADNNDEVGFDMAMHSAMFSHVALMAQTSGTLATRAEIKELERLSNILNASEENRQTAIKNYKNAVHNNMLTGRTDEQILNDIAAGSKQQLDMYKKAVERYNKETENNPEMREDYKMMRVFAAITSEYLNESIADANRIISDISDERITNSTETVLHMRDARENPERWLMSEKDILNLSNNELARLISAYNEIKDEKGNVIQKSISPKQKAVLDNLLRQLTEEEVRAIGNRYVMIGMKAKLDYDFRQLVSYPEKANERIGKIKAWLAKRDKNRLGNSTRRHIDRIENSLSNVKSAKDVEYLMMRNNQNLPLEAVGIETDFDKAVDHFLQHGDNEEAKKAIEDWKKRRDVYARLSQSIEDDGLDGLSPTEAAAVKNRIMELLFNENAADIFDIANYEEVISKFLPLADDMTLVNGTLVDNGRRSGIVNKFLNDAADAYAKDLGIIRTEPGQAPRTSENASPTEAPNHDDPGAMPPGKNENNDETGNNDDEHGHYDDNIESPEDNGHAASEEAEGNTTQPSGPPQRSGNKKNYTAPRISITIRNDDTHEPSPEENTQASINDFNQRLSANPHSVTYEQFANIRDNAPSGMIVYMLKNLTKEERIEGAPLNPIAYVMLTDLLDRISVPGFREAMESGNYEEAFRMIDGKVQYNIGTLNPSDLVHAKTPLNIIYEWLGNKLNKWGNNANNTPLSEEDMRQMVRGYARPEGATAEPTEGYVYASNEEIEKIREGEREKGITTEERVTVKDGVKTTRAVAMRNGKELVYRAFLPMPTEYKIREGDIPNGAVVVGLIELREGDDGSASATLLVKYNGDTLSEADVRMDRVDGTADEEPQPRLNDGKGGEDAQGNNANNTPLSEEQGQVNHEKEIGGDNTEQRPVGDGLRERISEEAPKSGDGVDIRGLQKGLASERYGNNERSPRKKQEEIGHKIIENAKSEGLFIERSSHKDFGKRKQKPSGESEVYVDENGNRVIKVKDPFAKSNLKGHPAADALYEHIVHNILFPNTRHKLLGISEGPIGDVRFVLEQDYFAKLSTPATQEQIDKYLVEVLGLTKVDGPYLHYENDYFVISDVDAGSDNILVNENGELFFIDPIIKFKKPASEVISHLTASETSAQHTDQERIDFLVDEDAAPLRDTPMPNPAPTPENKNIITPTGKHSNRSEAYRKLLENNITFALGSLTYNTDGSLSDRKNDPNYKRIMDIMDRAGAFDYVNQKRISDSISFVVTKEKIGDYEREVIWIVDGKKSKKANNGDAELNEKFGNRQVLNILDQSDIAINSPRGRLIARIRNGENVTFQFTDDVAKYTKGVAPFMPIDRIGEQQKTVNNLASMVRNNVLRLYGSKYCTIIYIKEKPYFAPVKVVKKSVATYLSVMTPNMSYNEKFNLYVMEKDNADDMAVISNFDTPVWNSLRAFAKKALQKGKMSGFGMSNYFLFRNRQKIQETVYTDSDGNINLGYSINGIFNALIIATPHADGSFISKKGEVFKNMDELLNRYFEQMLANKDANMTPWIKVEIINKHPTILKNMIESGWLYCPHSIGGRLANENVNVIIPIEQVAAQPSDIQSADMSILTPPPAFDDTPRQPSNESPSLDTTGNSETVSLEPGTNKGTNIVRRKRKAKREPVQPKDNGTENGMGNNEIRESQGLSDEPDERASGQFTSHEEDNNIICKNN